MNSGIGEVVPPGGDSSVIRVKGDSPIPGGGEPLAKPAQLLAPSP